MKVNNTEEAIERINTWQNSEFQHPLTCGNDSKHRPLVPMIIHGQDDDDELVLECPDCDYTQEQIPMCCIDGSLEKWEAAHLELLRKMNSKGE